MKKFLAVLLAVAVLAFAGTAMAAAPTLTASETASFTMKAGATKTITLTAAAANSGRLSPITLTADSPSWATISGNTLTLAPTATAAGNSYTVTAVVSETFLPPDAGSSAGHIAERTETATVRFDVAVIAANTSGTQIITKVVEVIKVVTVKITTIAQTVQKSAVLQTFSEAVRTVTETFTVTTLTKIEGFTSELATTWAAKALSVDTARAAVVNAIATNVSRRAAVFPGLPADAIVTPRANTSLVAATSSTKSSMTPAQKLAAMTAKLNAAGKQNVKALSAQEAVKATESGTYSFVKTFGKDLYGTKIAGSSGQRASNTVTTASTFTAALDNDTGVSFINSSGDVVTAIPGDEKSQDIMPGFVTMVVVMEAGKTYEPVVFATDTDLAAAGVSVDTTTTEVAYDEVTEEEKTVVVTVNDDGTIDETIVEEPDTSDPEVQARETKIKDAMGVSSLTAIPSAYMGTVAAATITADDTAAAEQNLHIAARTAAFTDLPAGSYYTDIKFRKLSGDLADGAAFMFYPDGIAAGTTAYAQVFNASGDEVEDIAAILSTSDVQGYVAFTIESTGEIKAADTNNTLENPTLAVEMKSSSTPDVPGDTTALRLTASETSLTMSVGDTKTVTLTATNVEEAAAFTFTADDAAGVSLESGTTTATATFAPTAAGSYQVVFTVTDSGRTTNNTKSVTVSLTVTSSESVLPSNNPGSSGGGCDAGFGVLALAVLGGFIAARKK